MAIAEVFTSVRERVVAAWQSMKEPGALVERSQRAALLSCIGAFAAQFRFAAAAAAAASPVCLARALSHSRHQWLPAHPGAPHPAAHFFRCATHRAYYVRRRDACLTLRSPPRR